MYLNILVDVNNKSYIETASSFLQINMSDKILKRIILPSYSDNFKYESYKVYLCEY